MLVYIKTSKNTEVNKIRKLIILINVFDVVYHAHFSGTKIILSYPTISMEARISYLEEGRYGSVNI